MNSLKNERGFQLIEIMLSISLLSIILLVYFGYFLQAGSFSKQNQNTGSASQLSQEILQKVRDSDLTSINSHSPTITLDNWDAIWDGTNLTQGSWLKLYPDISITGDYSIKLDNRIYYPKVKIIKADIYSQKLNLTNPFPTQLDMIIVEIEIDKNGGRTKVYETYGFKVRENNGE